MEGLKEQGKGVEYLIHSIKKCQPSKGNKLLDKLVVVKSLDQAFLLIDDYVSFFDFELVEYFIDGKLQYLLDEYLLKLNEFFQLRVHAISFDRKSNEKMPRLHFKIDCEDMEKLKFQDIKRIEKNLSDILPTKLYLVKIKKGCIELIFICLHEFGVIFPLSYEKMEQLRLNGITRLYSEDQEYFTYSPIVQKSNMPQHPQGKGTSIQ